MEIMIRLSDRPLYAGISAYLFILYYCSLDIVYFDEEQIT